MQDFKNKMAAATCLLWCSFSTLKKLTLQTPVCIPTCYKFQQQNCVLFIESAFYLHVPVVQWQIQELVVGSMIHPLPSALCPLSGLPSLSFPATKWRPEIQLGGLSAPPPSRPRQSLVTKCFSNAFRVKNRFCCPNRVHTHTGSI